MKSSMEMRTIRECEEYGWVQDRADPHARVGLTRSICRR